MSYFVWLRSMNGPKPQKVFAAANGLPPSKDKQYVHHHDVIFEQKLKPVEDNAGFDELIGRYPPPKEVCS